MQLRFKSQSCLINTCMVYYFANNSQTTLDGAINDTTTAVVVTDGSTFPIGPTYIVKIDDELIQVDGQTDPENWVVTRGAEGSTAAAHSNGATVSHILSAGVMNGIAGGGKGAYQFFQADGSGQPGWLSLNTLDSLQFSSGSLNLVGDTSSPGNNKLYGTDGSGTRGWQDGVKINNIQDADANGSVDIGTNVVSFQAMGGDVLTIDGSGMDPYVTIAPYFTVIGNTSFGQATLQAQTVSLGASGGYVGFYGSSTSTQQVVADGLMDGQIAALSFSSTPTQAECEALRDYCETLRDEIAALRQALWNVALLTPV